MTGRRPRVANCATCGSPITATSTTGKCRACVNRERGANRARGNQRRTVERMEDVRWMAETGESLTGAAARLDPPLSSDALDKWLRDQGAKDLLGVLLAREVKVDRSEAGRRAARTRFGAVWGRAS